MQKYEEQDHRQHDEPAPRFSGVNIPFVGLLGFQLRLFEGGRSQIDFDPRPEHMNSFGVVHGGAVMTLLDVSMGQAARSVQQDMSVLTIEMKTSFVRTSQGPLSCHGQLLHRTATMAFLEAKLYDAQQRLCAHATGTFKYAKRRPPPPGSDNPLDGIATD